MQDFSAHAKRAETLIPPFLLTDVALILGANLIFWLHTDDAMTMTILAPLPTLIVPLPISNLVCHGDTYQKLNMFDQDRIDSSGENTDVQWAAQHISFSGRLYTPVFGNTVSMYLLIHILKEKLSILMGSTKNNFHVWDPFLTSQSSHQSLVTKAIRYAHHDLTRLSEWQQVLGC